MSDGNFAAVIGPSLASQICNTLLRNSVALVIQKSLETQVSSSASLFLWSERDNGLLLHHDQIYVPKALHIKVIAQHYNDPIASHFEIQKTLELVSQQYYWLLSREVKKIL